MIQTQIALLQRELWEHRSLYFTPLVIAVFLILIAVTGQVSVNGEHLDLGIVGLSNAPENARSAALAGLMFMFFGMFYAAMGILTIFYCLDCLYAERKDRSILFWRSTPTTDFETVLSKLLVALLVIPLVTFAVVVATHIVVFIITSIWLSLQGANAWHLIWTSTPFFDTWIAILFFMLATPLWFSPFIGWFLFVSAFAKRSSFLTAFFPIAMLPLVEKILFGSTLLFEAIISRLREVPVFKGLDSLELMFEGDDWSDLADVDVSVLSLLDLGGFFSNTALWTGLIVCALFTTAAIYVRRYRDDS